MIDEYSRALVFINYTIHEIHEGVLFYAEHVDAAMEDTNKIELVITTPNTAKWAHAFIGVSATGASTLQIYEGVITSDDGIVIPPVNRNRNKSSSKEAAVVITHTPTITNVGTLIQTKYCGATGKFSADGEDQRNENEWLLKQNTKYLVRLTADAAIKGKVFCNWAEDAFRGF